MKKITLLMLFSCIAVSAQNLKLGFDFGISQIRISFPNGSGILSVSNPPYYYHLVLSYNIIEYFSFQGKIGRSRVTEFLGWEYGVNGKYKFYKPLYVECGYLIHSNQGGYYSNQLVVATTNIGMIQLGIGVDIFDFLSIGVNYYVPTSKKVIVWRGLFDKQPQTFESMIRLGFNFGWDL